MHSALYKANHMTEIVEDRSSTSLRLQYIGFPKTKISILITKGARVNGKRHTQRKTQAVNSDAVLHALRFTKVDIIKTRTARKLKQSNIETIIFTH